MHETVNALKNDGLSYLSESAYDKLASYAYKYMRAGVRSHKPTVGDIVTEYRHYIHDLSVSTPSLQTLGDYLVKKGSRYTIAPVRVIDNAGHGNQDSGESQAYDDVMELHRRLSEKVTDDEGLRVVFMQGISQSSIAIVGSCLALDPVQFLPHVDGDQTNAIQELVTSPVFFNDSMSTGQLTVLATDDAKPRTVLVIASLPQLENVTQWSYIIEHLQPRPSFASREGAFNPMSDDAPGSSVYDTLLGLILQNLQQTKNSYVDHRTAIAQTVQLFTIACFQDTLTRLSQRVLTTRSKFLPSFPNIENEHAHLVLYQEHADQFLQLIRCLQHKIRGLSRSTTSDDDKHQLIQSIIPLEQKTEYLGGTISKNIDCLMREMAIFKAKVSIEASKASLMHAQAGLSQSESVNRLTKLAFVFIPLSLVASIMSMDIGNFLAHSLPTFYVYVAVALPTMAFTLFAAWFVATIFPRLPNVFAYERHRFRSYLKDVDFRRTFMSRKAFDQSVSGTAKWIKRPVWRTGIWVSAWRPKPPPGLSELDSIPVEMVEEGAP